MKDLKIRVANEAESKEAQELFFELGYYWVYKNLGKKLRLSKKDVYLFAESDGTLGAGTRQDKVFFNNWCGEEITLQELRDMVNPMKEYLEKQADGSYKLVMRGIVGKDDDIEVPEGANFYCDRYFWMQLNSKKFWNGDNWQNDFKTLCGFSKSFNKTILWQRHVQPEELPFIDDKPKIETATGYQLDVVGKNTYGSRSRESGESDTSYRQYLMNFKINQSKSLNDQYAEIEQVRKHRHYFKDVSNIAEIDVYAVLKLFDVTDPCLQHIVKKALCAGKRGHKDMMEDLQNIVDTAIRAVELNS